MSPINKQGSPGQPEVADPEGRSAKNSPIFVLKYAPECIISSLRLQHVLGEHAPRTPLEHIRVLCV